MDFASQSGIGFPDLVIKEEDEEELCSQGSEESPGIPADQSEPSQRQSSARMSPRMRLPFLKGRNSTRRRGGDDSHLSVRTRGTAWRHLEVKDLLDIWGDSKVQEDLRASHRNLDIFESIAQEMRNRGHQRSAGECRSKTKAMRLEYRRVEIHNSMNETDKVTCPYYRELHQILGGDASVAPKRVCRSFRLDVPHLPNIDGRQVLDDAGLHSIDVTQMLEDANQITETVPGTPESEEGPTPAAQLQESPPSSPESLWEPSQRRNPAKMPPHMKLQLGRGRKITGRRGESIAVAMMQQQSEDAHLSRRMRRREHLELMGAVNESNLMMTELVDAFKEENATSAAQAEEVLQEMRAGTTVLNQMLDMLKTVQPLKQ